MLMRTLWYIIGVLLLNINSALADERTVTIVSHGWHTGIVLAQEDLGEDLAFVMEHLGEAPFYEFGWGDKAYYQEGEDKPWLMAPAALWPTETVMHVVAVPSEPGSYFPDSEARSLQLSAEGVEAMTGTIRDSFTFEDDEPRPEGEGLYGDSQFFSGEGRFHLGRTCNTWTLEMLAAGGLPVTPEGTIRARGVMSQLDDLDQ